MQMNSMKSVAGVLVSPWHRTELDAVQLDQQVEELFKQSVIQATKYFEPGILQPVLPELELLIRTWIFKYSLQNKKSTFGQNMLSLEYKKDDFSQNKLLWYYGYTIGLRYLKDRALYSLTSNTSVQNIVHKLETFQLMGDIFNFLRFIRSGKNPQLIDFLLGLEITADKLTREDLTDFSWTRELLWHNFIELIGTVISLMNMFGLKRKISNVLKYVWWREHKRAANARAPAMTLRTTCASCANRPVLPHTMGCEHIFCYYCLMELIGTVISLMNMFGLKRKISNVLKYVWWREHKRAANARAPAMTLRTTCASCANRPVLPHTMGCEHIFCYYCLMANKTADEDWACPLSYFNGKEISRFIMV